MEQSSQDEVMLWILIAIILIFGGFFLYSYLDFGSSDKTSKDCVDDCAYNKIDSNTSIKTRDDCTSLALEAEKDRVNCQLSGLKDLYGIDYEPNLRNGGSCWYTISDGYCIDEETASKYYVIMEESCSKSFPSKESVFTECLSKLE